MNKPTGIILAGGLSRRMSGGDKALMNLGRVPLITHVITRLQPQCQSLAINANGDISRFAPFDLPVLPDTIAGHPGPLAGILAAIEWAREAGHDHIVTAPADLPFIPSDLVSRLTHHLETDNHPKPVIAATTAERGASDHIYCHPLCALWPIDAHKAILRALNDGTRKVMSVTEELGARVEIWESEKDAFFNINTKEDLAKAHKILKGFL